MSKQANRVFRMTHGDRDALFPGWADAGAGSRPASGWAAAGDEMAFAQVAVSAQTGDRPGSAAVFPASFDLANLNGNNGIRLDGAEEFDRSGFSVCGAGDVNGDGLDDVIIGTSGLPSTAAGKSYVVFGRADGIPASFDLADLDGSRGFRLDGIPGDGSGFSVSDAGDVNGDGFGDVIIGAPDADVDGESQAGGSYVVFGQAGGHGGEIDLAKLDGTNGFRLEGLDAGDNTGISVSSAGDVNGDGFADVIIGADGAYADGVRSSGASYVVFGHAGGFDASLDLATLDGDNGFRIDGADKIEYSGSSVSSAGDFNGDGFDDIIIGAPGRGFNSLGAGESYVVFGHAGGFDASLDLATLDGGNGFRIAGADRHANLGGEVSAAGDVNGDGFDDIIIGARRADAGGERDAGASYVVFGHADGFAATLDLSTLDGGNGFRIAGIDGNDQSGGSVSSAGDVNGDGFDDILIGASGASAAGSDFFGASYVVFGRADGFDANLDLATLDGTNGIRLDGVLDNDRSGCSVSAAGDVNGDGFDDIIIGAYGVDANGAVAAGASYVVFGRATFDGAATPAEANPSIRGDATANPMFDADGSVAPHGGLMDALVGPPQLAANDHIIF